jgi:hypothetical protein
MSTTPKPKPLSPDWLAELFIGAYVEELTYQEECIANALIEAGHLHKDARKCLRPGHNAGPALYLRRP